MRKFASKQRTIKQASKQANVSNTETTLILCGYSRERANKRGDSTIKEEVRRRKMRKFTIKQRTIRQSDRQTVQRLRPL